MRPRSCPRVAQELTRVAHTSASCVMCFAMVVVVAVLVAAVVAVMTVVVVALVVVVVSLRMIPC